jgi:hypothetical protein
LKVNEHNTSDAAGGNYALLWCVVRWLLISFAGDHLVIHALQRALSGVLVATTHCHVA